MIIGGNSGSFSIMADREEKIPPELLRDFEASMELKFRESNTAEILAAYTTLKQAATHQTGAGAFG